MNRFPSRETVENIRKSYLPGIRVELLKMDDSQAPPAGSLGTVLGVDDIGSILVQWDCGSSLSVVYGEDQCRKVGTQLKGVVKEQILAIRETCETNMFDVAKVKEIALRKGYGELTNYLIENTNAYVRFILTGDER